MTCQNVFDPNDGYVCTDIYIASGSTASFVYTSNYLNKENWAVNSPNTADVAYNSYLTILKNGTAQNYTMSDNETLVLTSNPAADDVIVIRRNSSIEADGPKVTFQAGSVDPSLDQNKSARQMFYLAQELYDRSIDLQCQVDNQRFINGYQVTFNGSVNYIDLGTANSISGSSEEINLLSTTEIVVVLNSAYQQARTENYSTSVVGGVCRVTFVSTPVNGTKCEVRTLSSAVPQTLTVADNSITNAKLAGSITFDKMDWSALGSNGQFLGKAAGSWGAVTITTTHVSGLAAFITAYKVTDLTAPTGSFSMNSQKIVNLATPTSNTDAATKAYVDGVAATTYAPAYKAVLVTVTSTIQTVTGGGFTPDFIRLTIRPTTASGTANVTAYGPYLTYNQPKIYAWATIGSTQTWEFYPRIGGLQSVTTIDVAASGTNVTLKNTTASYDGINNHSVFIEFIKNSPNV